MDSETKIITNKAKTFFLSAKKKPSDIFYSTIGYALWAILAMLTYGASSWIAFVFSLWMTLNYVFQIFGDSTIYRLDIPAAKTYNVYRMGETYFVGTSEDEALLFAEINDLDVKELETISTQAYLYPND
jgi:hypothetical protein